MVYLPHLCHVAQLTGFPHGACSCSTVQCGMIQERCERSQENIVSKLIFFFFENWFVSIDSEANRGFD